MTHNKNWHAETDRKIDDFKGTSRCCSIIIHDFKHLNRCDEISNLLFVWIELVFDGLASSHVCDNLAKTKDHDRKRNCVLEIKKHVLKRN